MAKHLSVKQTRILNELGETAEREDLINAMERLDHYQVRPPTPRSTEALIAILKPVLQEGCSRAASPVGQSVNPAGSNRLGTVLHLVQPQVMLLNKGFVLGSILLLMAGLALTLAFKQDTIRFLTLAAPFLGVLTVFFEFRAKLSGTHEMEAACPYTPAQLATARMLVVLGYDILLCLAVTPLVSYWQGRMLGQVIGIWLAPLLMTLGMALAVSLHFGIISGCLVAGGIWFLQIAIGDVKLLALIGAKGQANGWLELARLGIGMGLMGYSCLFWNRVAGAWREDRGE